MDIATSIKTCFQKYAVFSGRASRSEFWWFALFTFIGGIVTSVADVMILGYVSEDWGPLNIIFSTFGDGSSKYPFSQNSSKLGKLIFF